jgi:hypothetical protein
LPLTQFYHFVITLADAIVPDLELDGTADRRYQIVETPQRGWAISEDRRPIALADEQQARLAQLLAALERLPDPGVDQALAGSDGTWVSVVVQTGDQQRAYRWWVHPPAGWLLIFSICRPNYKRLTQ